MSARDLLDSLSVPSPCSADWESMIGNDQVRFCRHCNLSVHNLSSLTRKAALRLIARSNGRLCVRYISPPDGPIKTRSSPPSIHRIGRHASRLAAGAFSASLTVSGSAAARVPFDRSQFPAVEVSGIMEKTDREPRVDQSLGTVVERPVEVVDQLVTVQGSATLTLPNEPLVLAAQSDDIEAVRHLLVGKPNPNIRDKQTDSTALEHAVLNANRGMAQLLILAGADVNSRDRLGRTPLMMFGDDTTPEAVWDLINAGAKVNQRDNVGDTALTEAAEYNNTEVLKALLDAGAKVNARNNDGLTALMRAAKEGLVNNVRLLILAGAEINLHDGEGKTAWAYAAENYHDAVLRLLRSFGADQQPEQKP